MHNRIATTIALAMCALAVVVPIAAALYLAHRQSMDEAAEQARTLTGEVLRRADTASEQALSAYRRISRLKMTDVCSDAKRAQLREITMDYSNLQAIGYVSGNRLVCSALGPAGDGIDMGPPSYIGPAGTRIYLSATIGGSQPLLVMDEGGFAGAIHPEALLDVPTSTPNLSLGVYSPSSRLPWAHRGTFDPAWTRRLTHSRHVVFFDGKFLVAIQVSSKFDVAAYTAIPLAELKSRLNSFLIILLPIGLALGTAMTVAVVFLARQRGSLPAVLRASLKRKEFVLHYQPIVELASGRMIGVEALLRWPANKQIGMRPALFIQAAEECGLIQRFTEYVLVHVAEDAQRYLAQHPDCYISLNLSPTDLGSDDVVHWLRGLVATPGVAARNIVVEVTEHSFVDPAGANRTIAQIRALGIRVAIDDFGTGFSSLSRLTNLSADYLKIDKVFVDAIGTDSVTSEVVLHIIEMAKSLNLSLISEGVETREQADFLLEHGVVFGQGWLFGKAQPLTDLLRQHASS